MSSYEYQVGGSLKVNALSYVVRKADADLYQALQAGEFCCVFNSRQMGKSSLRVRIRHQLQQIGTVCASLDITRISSQHITPQQWYGSIAFELLHDFGLLERINFRQWWNVHKNLSGSQRLSLLIEEILVMQFPQKSVCIFVDEIDDIFSFPLMAHGFFALIRNCYQRRAECNAYTRLTWALFGVTNLPHLVNYDGTDKVPLNYSNPPFGMGRLIELQGFQESEAQPLITGLLKWVCNPQAILRSILAWTGGQPFLTQKVCQLVVQASQIAVNQRFFPPGTELLWVEQLVRSHIIQNWETQDHPEHLRTIRNYLLRNKQQVRQLLELYQKVLKSSNIPIDYTVESTELLLSGLVENQEGMLRVKNSIYREVFNSTWVEKRLKELYSS